MIILGGGLVGSLLALRLRQRGFTVQVFEKRSDPRKNTYASGRSINLIMTSRGLHAMQLVGLKSELKKIVVPVFGRTIHSKTGDPVYQPYGQKNECNYAVSRHDLNILLMNEAEKAGAQFHFSHDLQEISLDEKKMSFLTPEGGVWKNYETLFATDGAGSVIRKRMCEKDKNLFVEKTTWLEADYKELTMTAGLSCDALHIWPRRSHMMMALANRDGSMTITVYMPKTGSDYSFEQLKTPQAVNQFFSNEFSDATALMPDYIEQFLSHPQGQLGTVRMSQWNYKNEILLLGDAAHAIVPFFGQGMNCGFEDVTELDQYISLTNSMDGVFSGYAKHRKPQADAIADMALENWIEMKERVANPQFLLKKKLEAEIEKKFPQLFKSRYGMITYTRLPYAETQELGKVQSHFLDLTLGSQTQLDSVDWTKIENWLKTDWSMQLTQRNLAIQNYDMSL